MGRMDGPVAPPTSDTVMMTRPLWKTSAALALALAGIVSRSISAELPEPKVIDPGPAAVRRHRAVRWQGPVAVEEREWRRGQMDRPRRLRGGERHRQHPDQRTIRRRPTARRMGHARARWRATARAAATAASICRAATKSRCSTPINNKTYPDGQAGAFYGNFAPLVNASRKPGEWQTYDIIFQAPKAERRRQDGRAGLLHRAAQWRAGAEPRAGEGIDHGRSRSRAPPPKALWSCRTTATRSASATSGFARCN